MYLFVYLLIYICIYLLNKLWTICIYLSIYLYMYLIIHSIYWKLFVSISLFIHISIYSPIKSTVALFQNNSSADRTHSSQGSRRLRPNLCQRTPKTWRLLDLWGPNLELAPPSLLLLKPLSIPVPWRTGVSGEPLKVPIMFRCECCTPERRVVGLILGVRQRGTIYKYV